VQTHITTDSNLEQSSIAHEMIARFVYAILHFLGLQHEAGGPWLRDGKCLFSVAETTMKAMMMMMCAIANTDTYVESLEPEGLSPRAREKHKQAWQTNPARLEGMCYYLLVFAAQTIALKTYVQGVVFKLGRGDIMSTNVC
jgi:hypothetical protein